MEERRLSLLFLKPLMHFVVKIHILQTLSCRSFVGKVPLLLCQTKTTRKQMVVVIFVPTRVRLRFAVTFRGRACCRTSCGVSACRIWRSSTRRMSWICTRQRFGWGETPRTRWAQGPARCPGRRVSPHGRVRPRPPPLLASDWDAWSHRHVCLCSFQTELERSKKSELQPALKAPPWRSTLCFRAAAAVCLHFNKVQSAPPDGFF